MDDLISRQAAMNAFAERAKRSNNSDFASTPTWNDAVEIVENLPSADVQPVRHGKWIDMADFEQCSSCSGTRLKEMQTVYGKAIWIKTPYCPNCGARMDGE